MEREDYLKQILEGIKRINSGEYEHSIPLSGSYPEFDAIAGSINSLTTDLIRKTESLQERNYIAEANQKQLSSIINSLQVMIFVIDYETHKIVEINKMAEDLFELSKEEIIGRECHHFICPNNKGNCPISDLKKSVAKAECNLLDGKGNVIPIMKTVIEIEYNGRRSLLESAVNISEIKNNEKLLLESEKALKNHKEMFELAVRGSTAGIWEWNILKNEFFLSPEWKQDMGYSDQLPMSEFRKFLNKIHDEDTRPFLEKASAFLKGNSNNYEDEFRLLIKNGEYRWILCRGVATRRFGKPLRVAGSLLDITDLKNAKLEAEQANLAKSHFLSNMSHEIRTPMNAILGFSEILEKKITDPDLKEQAKSISTAGNTLLGLINDILDISKIESGRLDIQKGSCQIKNVFHDMQNVYQSVVDKKGIELKIEIAERLPQLLFLDKKRVRQVLLNLIGNAIKYTDKGFVKLSVNIVNIDQENGLLDMLFSVEDSGIGIKPELTEAIFNPFTQELEKKENMIGGSGLGLAITRGLVNMMNGELNLITNADPEKGPTGSIFTVRLNGIKIDSNNLIQDEKRSLGSINFNNGKVLIVDDILLNRKLIEGYLHEFDFQIYHAENGKEGIEKAGDILPDVILMDIRMPVMGGKEASLILKANPQTKNIPIIAMTANIAAEEFEMLKKNVFNVILEKPISSQELRVALEQNFRIERFDEAKTAKKKLPCPEIIVQDDIRDLLPEIIGNLESEYSIRLENLKKTFIMSHIRNFADEILDYNKTIKLEILDLWANNVISQVVTFDMNNLPQTLDNFSCIIEQLNETLKRKSPS